MRAQRGQSERENCNAAVTFLRRSCQILPMRRDETLPGHKTQLGPQIIMDGGRWTLVDRPKLGGRRLRTYRTPRAAGEWAATGPTVQSSLCVVS